MKKLPSLRVWLAGMLLFCWLLPVAAIVGAAGYFISGGFQDRIRDTVTTSVENALSQVSSRISSAIDASRAASYDGTIRQAWQKYLEDGDRVDMYARLTDYLVGKYAYDDSFRATMLFFPDGPDDIYYAYHRSFSGAASELRKFIDTVYDAAREQAEGMGTGVNFFMAEGSLYMIRNIVDANFTPYGVLVMECNQPELFESVEAIVWLSGARLSVDGMGCASLGAGADGSVADNSVTQLGESRYLVSRTGTAAGHSIRICAEADGAKLTEAIPRLTTVVWLVTGTALVLLLASVWTMGRQVTAPVNALVEAAGRVEAGERGYTVSLRAGNMEMFRLTNHFNSMSAQLKRQFERSYQEQLALQDARVRALQSQINPHFLNNTLETINWEARMAGNAKVSRMIEALSDLLDAATVRGGSASGPLAEELRYTDAYLYIISERFGERLRVRRQVDESLLELRVPKLILQPIVENAVEHGVAKQMDGELLVRVYRLGNSAAMEVEHNGHMTDEDRENIARLLDRTLPETEETAPGRVGIRNVDRRLQLLYGDGGGLTVAETPQGHIMARILIPLPPDCPSKDK